MVRLQASRLVLVVSVLTLIIAACAPAEDDAAEPAAAAEDPDEPAAAEPTEGDTEAAAHELDEVCAQGQEEGSFTVWQTVEPENFDLILEEFSKTYPGIEADFLSTRDTEAVQRIITAVNAGQAVEPDLVGGSMFALDELVQRELVDDEVDWVSVGIDEGLIQPTNLIRDSRVAIGLAYNTDTTSPDDLPDTWEELIDEQYAQDVIVDPRKPLNMLALEWGEGQTLDYVQRFKDVVDPVIIEGGTAGMVAVLSGEAMTTVGARADSNLEMQADGAPIDIKYLDLVPVDDNYLAPMVESENPNAVLCYVGWLYTPEGAAFYGDVEFKTNTDVPPGIPEDALTLKVESPEEASFLAELTRRITEILVQ